MEKWMIEWRWLCGGLMGFADEAVLMWLCRCGCVDGGCVYVAVLMVAMSMWLC
jgi:hypothetical protein